ncbi:Dimeric dihydrodiol dehydrogenase [Ceraceosorus bombacis]|uniref:D-xylose 1-dehydrogenase (NADP(+), D-xylono-1,5-lactone-forming) n=1 Tax=Ceraceosorus bombacis TaxID=401625 RepID=A0A0P1BQI7_9BASI|nr:Dimeric dihydrodiol dehydrogenase [Ceraceosorus bombacis]
MNTSRAYTARWGILATGGIAKKFAGDLLVDPATRDAQDVCHQIVAVASSSSAERAQAFIESDLEWAARNKAEKPHAYGSYEEMLKDKQVQIVYVATPHSHHYANVLQCLDAGKHVCCEKPFTINAMQTKHLVDVARSKKLFLMEAMWIRFFPIVREIQRLLHQEKVLGKLHRAHSELGVHFDNATLEHRLLNPELGGGALLDLGIYPLTWQLLTLFEDPSNERQAPRITSNVLKHPVTGVDEFTSLIFNFEKGHTQGIMTANFTVRTHSQQHTLIQGEKGDLTVHWAPFRPTAFTITLRKNSDELGEPKTTEFDIPGGHGMFWEADACARALRDGKFEADLHPLSNSIFTMEIMDQVRASANLKYPQSIEAVHRS